jgi:probable rRNA maturation factor
MVDLVFQNFTSDKEFGRDFFYKILSAGFEELNLSEKNSEVSLNLVEEDKIQELNQKYRNKNKPTDVLSFPLDDKSPEQGGTLLLGDIFICLSIAKNEAKRENINIDEKLARLTVHGFLHLMGYDHETSAKDAGKMLDLENKILESIK